MVSGQNLNSSKFSCMSSLLPARIKMIQSKMKELEWSQHFSHYKSMGFFFQTLKSCLLRSPLIWPNFELVRDFMVVLVTCKNEEYPIESKAIECSQHYASVFQTLKDR